MLKIDVHRVETICDGWVGNARTEITGVVRYPFTNQELSALLRDRAVLVPLGSVDAERDAVWTKALAEGLGGDTAALERVVAAFNRLAAAPR